MSSFHPTLQRQISNVTRPNGTLDASELLQLISNKYAELTKNQESGEANLSRLAAQFAEINRRLCITLKQLEITLETVQHGVFMIDASGCVRVCNANAIDLLDLPHELIGKDFSLSKISDALQKHEVAIPDDRSTAQFKRADGKYIEIHAKALPEGGAVILVEDVTVERNRERDLQQAEAEYRSLFDNSVYGIYRDTLEGVPVRANPALVALNGYGSEAEHIAAVKAEPSNWYVEPGRFDDFNRMLESEGRVKDLVSEVYRHRTKERVWITENAWYVRDVSGKPVFIEGTIQDATERTQALSEIERLANCDPMTGAANRFRFMRVLHSRLAANTSRVALYCVDLDHFKQVNDALGHAAGDIVLQTMTERLKSIISEKGTVARFGGDEFAILLNTGDGEVDVTATAARIVGAANLPIEIGGHSLIVGCSVGVAIFPDHASDAEVLLGNADLALYHVKSRGRNSHYIFDHSLKQAIDTRKQTERELRTAIHSDMLELHYQPIVCSNTGAVHSFESLIRWNHVSRGIIFPDAFIPLAEESGLMAELGAWAIMRACEQACHLPAKIGVAVNVSPTQLHSPSILGHVTKALEKTGLDPSRLELEVTETAILANQSNAKQVLSQLRNQGIRIALDDFGTGHSSLSNLQRFAFSTVKIDRSFVAGMLDMTANLAIIRAVLGIGRDLGIQVVAEGVETLPQFEALKSEGCTLMQGYYFARPQPLVEAMNEQAIRQLAVHRQKQPPESEKRLKSG